MKHLLLIRVPAVPDPLSKDLSEALYSHSQTLNNKRNPAVKPSLPRIFSLPIAQNYGYHTPPFPTPEAFFSISFDPDSQSPTSLGTLTPNIVTSRGTPLHRLRPTNAPILLRAISLL